MLILLRMNEMANNLFRDQRLFARLLGDSLKSTQKDGHDEYIQRVQVSYLNISLHRLGRKVPEGFERKGEKKE